MDHDLDLFYIHSPCRSGNLQSGIYICQQLQKKFLIKAAGIYAHLIVGQILPFFIGKEFIVGSSGFIHFLYQGPGAFFFPAQAFHNRLDTVFKRRIDKQAETFVS